MFKMEFNASIDKVVGIKELKQIVENRKILGFDVISESILVHDSGGGFFIVNVCVNVPEDRSNEFFELVKEGVCKLSSIYLM